MCLKGTGGRERGGGGGGRMRNDAQLMVRAFQKFPHDQQRVIRFQMSDNRGTFNPEFVREQKKKKKRL